MSGGGGGGGEREKKISFNKRFFNERRRVHGVFRYQPDRMLPSGV